MNVLNIHTREIAQPAEKVAALLDTLSTRNDRIWPNEKWPAIRFKDGLVEGAQGGHGFIRYFIKKYDSASLIEFQFMPPTGLVGVHRFEIIALSTKKSLIQHTIDAKTTGMAKVLWPIMIRPLHDALIEDAFDNIQSQFNISFQKQQWSLLVRFWRFILK